LLGEKKSCFRAGDCQRLYTARCLKDAKPSELQVLGDHLAAVVKIVDDEYDKLDRSPLSAANRDDMPDQVD
jgi:hypothetical protein